MPCFKVFTHVTCFSKLLVINDFMLQVNKWGNVIYDEYVRPLDHVVDFRTKISGIRPRDLRKGMGYL